MDNVGNKMSLLEGIGDEVLQTTLILATLIFLFNLYWVYFVFHRRNEQTRLTQQQTRLTQQQSTLNSVIETDPATTTTTDPATTNPTNPATTTTTTNPATTNPATTTTTTNPATTNPATTTTTTNPATTTTTTKPAKKTTSNNSDEITTTSNNSDEITTTSNNSATATTPNQSTQKHSSLSNPATTPNTTIFHYQQTNINNTSSQSTTNTSNTSSQSTTRTTTNTSGKNMYCHLITIISFNISLWYSTHNFLIVYKQLALVNHNDLSIKLQFVNGLQRVVSASLDDTLGDFKRRHFSSEMTENRRVRLIMNGQELKNDSCNLRSYKLHNGLVLHCLVSQNITTQSVSHPYQSPQQHQPQHNRRFLNLGSFLHPIIGAVLALFWYARIYYRVYFNGASTFSLVVLSCFYVFSSLALFRIPVSSENLHQN